MSKCQKCGHTSIGCPFCSGFDSVKLISESELNGCDHCEDHNQ